MRIEHPVRTGQLRVRVPLGNEKGAVQYVDEAPFLFLN